jgi:HAD superfamily hydrolase (TIGR01509 family)
MAYTRPPDRRTQGRAKRAHPTDGFCMNFSAVIFDMDGVLVDTEPYYFKSNRALFAELGFTVPKEEYVHFVGSSAQLMWSTLKRKFSLKQTVDELIEMEYAAHRKNIAAVPALVPIPGIRAFLERLRGGGASLAVASSSPRRVVELTLGKAGLAEFFPVTVCGEEIERGKPHPDIFLKTARLLNAPPADCLVIEDSPRGIEGARAAGMKTVGFRNPNSGDQDLSRADVVIDSFSEAVIRRLLSMPGSGKIRKATGS